MSEEKHHHSLFHHHKDGNDNKPVDYAKEEKSHKHKQHLAELGTVAAGAFALVS